MLQIDFLLLRHRLDARHDFKVIAAAVGDRRALADFHVAVLRLVHRRVIGRVRHVHDQRHVRF